MYFSAGVWGVATALPVVEPRIRCHYFPDTPCMKLNKTFRYLSWWKYQTLAEYLKSYSCHGCPKSAIITYELDGSSMIVGESGVHNNHVIYWIHAQNTTKTIEEAITYIRFQPEVNCFGLLPFCVGMSVTLPRGTVYNNWPTERTRLHLRMS